MSRQAVHIALGIACTLLTLVTSPAHAAQSDTFTATIDPTLVQPNSNRDYTIEVHNLGSSDDAANTAHIAVPAGFTVVGTVSATTSGGGCAAATWAATLSADGSTIDAAALSLQDDLCAGATLTVAFTASSPTPAVDTEYEWETTLFLDATQFTLQGAPPTLTVDVTAPPAPSLTATPPNPSNNADATFGFSDDEATATFSCQLDSGAFAPCSSPTSYNGLGEGAHTFAVVAVDAAGNQSSATSYAWTIDLTSPPSPTLTDMPPNVTASTDASFSFVDADATATFQCSLDDAAFSACTSPVEYHGLSAGAHTFDVKAVDPAGNESTTTSYPWTIDLTDPVVTIDPASEPPDPTNQTSASFVFTSNKAGSTFECRLDTDVFAPCPSPKAYSGLADGRYTFGVRAKDPAGNTGLPTEYEWTVDTLPPVTTITGQPPAVTSSTAASFTFTSSEVASFACSLDGGAVAACTSPKAYTGLADGGHVFRVQATDRAGNTDPSPPSYSWQVQTEVPPDTRPPGTVTGMKRRVGYRQLRLTWSLPTDPDFDHIDVLRSQNAKGAARSVVYEGKAAAYTDKRFQNGTFYRYVVVAYDRSGNGSAGVRVVVPPSALLHAPRDGGLVRGPPVFLWSGVPRASYYNVQVFRGSHKVLSAWPSKARLRMRSRWVYQGRSFRLRNGGYRWWVWPAFGPRSKGAYGQLLGTGTFVVR